MTNEMDPRSIPADDKAHIRDDLDLTNAEWQHAEDPDPDAEQVEIAFITHTDGNTYIAMRNSKRTGPDDAVLVFTESEWDAFVAGARAGEFNERPDPLAAQ